MPKHARSDDSDFDVQARSSTATKRVLDGSTLAWRTCSIYAQRVINLDKQVAELEQTIQDLKWQLSTADHDRHELEIQSRSLGKDLQYAVKALNELEDAVKKDPLPLAFDAVQHHGNSTLADRVDSWAGMRQFLCYHERRMDQFYEQQVQSDDHMVVMAFKFLAQESLILWRSMADARVTQDAALTILMLCTKTVTYGLLDHKLDNRCVVSQAHLLASAETLDRVLLEASKASLNLVETPRASLCTKCHQICIHARREQERVWRKSRFAKLNHLHACLCDFLLQSTTFLQGTPLSDFPLHMTCTWAQQGLDFERRRMADIIGGRCPVVVG